MNEIEVFSQPMTYYPLEQPIPAEAQRTAMIDTSNLQKCIEDIKDAARNMDAGPEDPENYPELLRRLEASKEKLPPVYRDTVFEPYMDTLKKLGVEKFNEILSSDPNREGAARLMLDIAQAVIQNGEKYNQKATDAFQEVLSDLYDGFLSAEDRKGVKPPDISIEPPLAKWGNPSAGPYTWPVDATISFGVETAIVNLPPVNARQGLLAWTAIPHESPGHNVLHGDIGLMDELRQSVWAALRERNTGSRFADYWADRIDETASDVVGILNMGPMAGMGLIGYFRGLNLAFSGSPRLRNTGPQEDVHPADILRGYLAAACVRLLSFSGAANWSKVIKDETDKDLSRIILEDREVSIEDALESCSVVASVIMHKKLKSLEFHALGDIQNWHDRDEDIARQLGTFLTSPNTVPGNLVRGAYAAHVVAAAAEKALSRDSDIPMIFNRMVDTLKVMHDGNPAWGPLFIRYPGDIVPHKIYSNFEKTDMYH